MSETEEYYPNIDPDAFSEMIEATEKCDKLVIDTTVFYIIKGTGNATRRTFSFRTNNFVDFNFATTWAFRLKIIGPLMAWFKEHRGWNDGVYL